MARILIVDDERFFCQQVKTLLMKGGYACGFILTPEILFSRLEEQKTDLILLDIYMSEMDGLSVLRQLKSHPIHHRLPVIVLTADTDDQLLASCFELGAIDFVNKPINKISLQSRIQVALSVQDHIQELESQKKKLEKRTMELIRAYDQLQQEVAQRQQSEKQLAETQAFLFNLLTPREKEILQLIVDGCASKEIAYELGLSISTIENHRYNLMQKLNVHDVATLISLALKNKLVSLS